MTIRPLHLLFALQLLVAFPLTGQNTRENPPREEPAPVTGRREPPIPLELVPTRGTALCQDRPWDVPVKDACVVDSVTVSGITDFGVEEFLLAVAVAEDAITGNADAKKACDKAKEQCKLDLPRKAWTAANDKCKVHGKGSNERTKCKATRGNLDLSDITVANCTFEGIEGCADTDRTIQVVGPEGVIYQVKIRKCSKWKARAECKAPDILYVCDP